MSFISQIVKRFTSHCSACRLSTSNGANICGVCKSLLIRNIACCVGCALPLPAESTDTRCGHCQREAPSFDRTFAPFVHQGLIRHFIHEFKFRDKLSHRQLLAELFAEQVALTPQFRLPQGLIAVPLHHKRLGERGYNQALELAKPLANHFALPLNIGALTRDKATQEQSTLKAGERKRNIRGAFTLGEQIPWQHVALVDDVLTTGQTVNEIARLLKHNGVEVVDVWVMARAAGSQ